MPGSLPGAGVLMNTFRNLQGILTEPIFRGLIWSVLKEPLVDMRDEGLVDESIGSFISRRFSPHVADNIVSAVCHGIYAGDIYDLSARTLLPMQWMQETRDGRILGSIAATMSSGVAPILKRESDYRLAIGSDDLDEEKWLSVRDIIGSSSVFTFQHGLEQLAQGLVTALKAAGNVRTKTGTQIKQVTREGKSGDLILEDRDGSSESFNYVVSTVPQLATWTMLKRNDGKPIGRVDPWIANHSVPVLVVNLYYSNPSLVPVRGFGYLIPRTVPLEQNPERALGVLFASESSVGQDTAPGTKLTVMLGGHWWKDYGLDSLPDEQSGIEMARSILARHLGIIEKPVVAKARLARGAIPQYRPLHHKRMQTIHSELLAEFHGRFRVAGSAYHGVGVNDCTTSARKASYGIREGIENSTGLEHFRQDEWVIVSKQGEATTVKVD